MLNINLKLGLLYVAAALGALLLALGLWYGITQFQRHTADYRGDTQVKNSVNGNGNYRIQAYDRFHDLCNNVIADKEKVAQTQVSLKSANGAMRSNLEFVLFTQRNVLINDVNQYNSDASKDYTLGQFRSSDLPFKLFIKGVTVCG